MRLISTIGFVVIVLTSCGPGNADPDSITFITNPVQSPSLLVRPTLRLTRDQQFKLDMKLENLAPGTITIHDVTCNNPPGLSSSIESIGQLIVQPGSDTTVSTTFRQINDRKLFYTTGLPGPADSVYHLAVYYSVENKEGLRVVNLVSKMPEDVFLSYRKKHEIPVEVYLLDTTGGFDEQQRLFMVHNSVGGPQPFVHTTRQELAMGGLNFRIRCFTKRDSLHTEILIVNHSEMTIRIDTASLGPITDCPEIPTGAHHFSIEKVTGSKTDISVLRKGDRMRITIAKLIARHPDQLMLSFVDSFFMGNGAPLFHDNPVLVRFSRSSR